MKVFKIALAIIGLFCFALVCLIVTQKDPWAPEYVRLQTQPKGLSGRFHYDWGGYAPFVDGKVWVFTFSRTNVHEYLFDLEQEKFLGELHSAGAELATRDYAKILCSERGSPVGALRGRIIARINKVCGRAIISTNSNETVWIIDVKNNKSRRLGSLSQIPGTGSRWHPSPDFKCGFNVPNNYEDDGHAFYLCNLEEETFRRVKFEGQVLNWWDERRVLIKDPFDNLVLYDVFAGTNSLLLSNEMITSQMNKAAPGCSWTSYSSRSTWDGTNYDFMLFATYSPTYGPTIFQLDRQERQLTLFQTNFQFTGIGAVNSERTAYVFDRQSNGFRGNGEVYLRDFRSQKMVTLIPQDGSGQFSLPRFYKNSVVYYRSNELWRIETNGSNNVRVLPPPEKS